jgi:hypothetical protein
MVLGAALFCYTVGSGHAEILAMMQPGPADGILVNIKATLH